MPLTAKHRRFLLFGGIALVCLLLDLVTKAWVWHAVGEPLPTCHRGPHGRIRVSYQSPEEKNIAVIGEGALAIKTTYNPGAFAGLGGGYPRALLAVTIIMVPIIIWIFAKSETVAEAVLLAMILGGTLGNMYDRMLVRPAASEESLRACFKQAGGSVEVQADLARARVHMVRDFIAADLGFRPPSIWLLSPCPTFNVADSLLSVGVTGLIIFTLFFMKKKEPGKGAAGHEGKRHG